MAQTSENVKKPIKKPIIYEFHVNELTNKKTGQSRASQLIDGFFNYIFDDYRRKDNFVRVKYGNNTKYNPDGVYLLTCSELLLHLNFWYLNYIYAKKLKKEVYIIKSDFFQLVPFDSNCVTKIMNYSMEKFVNEESNIDELSFYTSKIIESIIEIAEGYSSISCNSFSLYDIIQLMRRNKEFRDCMNTKLDENKPVKEIEMQIKMGEKRVMRAIIEDNQSQLIPYVHSKRMNSDQFTQAFFAVGPRTDIDKTILPKIMPTNYFKGYDSVSSYYIDSITGRDAQILKHSSVRESGYLSRKINLACLNIEINYDVEDCGTTHYLDYYIKDDDFLKSIDKKYMITSSNKLKMINHSEDKNLIGQTVRIRSHICCALTDNKVCQVCYGGKNKQVKGTRIGGLLSIKLANVMSKRIMRAKHFTTTNSVEINKALISKYFDIETNKFYVKSTLDTKGMFIVVNREYVEEIIEGNVDIDEDGVDAVLPLESITIRNNGKEDLIECDGMFLILTDEILAESSKFILDLDSDDALIPLSKLDKDIPIFNLVIITEEVSRYLKKVKQEIDTNKIKQYANYSDFVNNLIGILIESGMIGTSINHVETLTYHLIRDKVKTYLRPDFTQPIVDYALISVSQSILKGDVYTAIAFQEFKSIMKDAESYEKNLSGILDNIFRASKPKYVKRLNIEEVMLLANKT